METAEKTKEFVTKGGGIYHGSHAEGAKRAARPRLNSRRQKDAENDK